MFSVIPKSLIYSSIFRGKTLYNRRKKPFAGQILPHTREITGDDMLTWPLIRGIDFLRIPKVNRTLAFTTSERQSLGINGLLAGNVKSLKRQLDICKAAISRYKNPLNKHLFLTELHDTNERLFFNLISSNVAEYMPLVYTPVVGLACQKFGFVYRRPKGLFITIHDKGNVQSIINNWPEHNIRAICFTDGARILGLGDLGAFGMGIPIGKLSLYTALAKVRPYQCLPVTLDVGTNNENLLSDPLYIGIRQRRTTGAEYDEFIEEFMEACTQRYGPAVLLQFEDFALEQATPLLKRYQDRYCTFNDDIQGTASVAVAGILSATRITKKKISENVIMFLGAGSAATGIANLCVDAMKSEGTSAADGYKKIYLFDKDGLLTTKRKMGIPPHAKMFSRDDEHITDFQAAIAKYKPTVLIGCSTVGGAFTPKILTMMAEINERPVIFALSNPTHKAECTAQDAYDHTKGRCVYASGSPFPPVKYEGRTYITGQGNNSYIFPGLALGVLMCYASRIPDVFFLQAAKTLAKIVSEKDLEMGNIYPPLNDIQKISDKIAIDVAELAYKMSFQTADSRNLPKVDYLMLLEYMQENECYNAAETRSAKILLASREAYVDTAVGYVETKDLASKMPKPDLGCLLMSEVYSFDYPKLMPKVYDYPPDPPYIKIKSIEELHPMGKIPHTKDPSKGKPTPI